MYKAKSIMFLNIHNLMNTAQLATIEIQNHCKEANCHCDECLYQDDCIYLEQISNYIKRKYNILKEIYTDEE